MMPSVKVTDGQMREKGNYSTAKKINNKTKGINVVAIAARTGSCSVR